MAFRRLGLTYRKPQTLHVRKSEHQLIKIEASTLEHVRAFYAVDFEAYDYDPTIAPTHRFCIVPGSEPPVVAPLPPPTPPPMWRRAICKIKRGMRAATTQVTD